MRFKSRSRALIGAAAAASLALAGLTTVAPSASAAPPDAQRVAGETRYGTAADAATTAFPTGADTVVLTTGQKFPDALAANGLAGANDAPVLLTQTDQIPAATEDALTTLDPTTVILVGGTNAVSADVEAALDADGFDTPRFAGEHRFETAAAVATEIGTAPAIDAGGGEGAQSTVVLANGLNFPDAVSVSPGLHSEDIPLLLTFADTLQADADAAIDSLGADQVIIVGGTGVVSQDIEDGLEAEGKNVVRLAGPTRFETATAIANFFLDELGFTATDTFLATGQEFPDALAGGPLASVMNGPLVLTGSLPDATETFLNNHASEIETLWFLGGTAAIDQATEDDALAAADPGEPTTNQSFTVSQDDQLVAVDNSVTNSFSGLDPAETYDVILFPCYDDAAIADGEIISFLDADEDATAEYEEDSNLSGEGETEMDAAFIESINGNPVALSEDEALGVSPTSAGDLEVVTDSASTDCARVLVFEDGDGDNELDLDAGNLPTEPFALSGANVWHLGEAPQGTTPHENVLYVDTSGPGGVILLEDGFLYFYDDDDGFCAFDCDVDLTLDEFEAAINIPEDEGDELDQTDAPATPYDRGGVNHYNLDHDDIHPPTGVTLADSGDLDGNADDQDIELSWMAPSPANGIIQSYDVRVYEDDGATVDCDTGTELGSSPFSTDDATTSLVIENVGTGDFCAEVEAENEEGDSVPSEPLRFTVEPADVPTIDDAVLTTDTVVEGAADTNDVWTLTFSEAMDDTIGSETLIIDDEDGDRIHVVCDLAVADDDLTSATCGWDGTDTELTITLAEAPEDRNAGGDGDILYPLTIVDTANLEDADEGAEVDVAGSPDVVIGEGGTTGD